MVNHFSPDPHWTRLYPRRDNLTFLSKSANNLRNWAASDRATLAIVFTDIVGSTAFGNEVGDQRMDEIRDDHFAQGQRLIERYKGYFIKTIGDSLMVAFRSVDAALDFARRFLNNPGARKIDIRVGIHVGSVDVKDNDIFGSNVNLAARVAGAFKESEIWLSDEAMKDLKQQRAEKFNSLNWSPHSVTPRGFEETTFWSLHEPGADPAPKPPAPNQPSAPKPARGNGMDFNAGDHRQRKVLREVLTKLFGRERALAMFLDEELGMTLRNEIGEGPFKEQVYELIGLLTRLGRLNELIAALRKNEEYAQAPALRDLFGAWPSVTEPVRASPTLALESVQTTPIERILDGQTRMRPMDWISGIAALRRRVFLLRRGNLLATGFLVGPNLALSAAHVFHESTGNGRFEAVFDYGIDGIGKNAAHVVAIQPPTIVDPPEKSQTLDSEDYLKSLDYVLFPLADQVGRQRLEDGTTRGWFDLTANRERLREGEQVMVLQHPQGKGMALSQGIILPSSDDPTRLSHNCTTDLGASGAPVVDAMLRLVGLHERHQNGMNLAVRADRIARDLQERGVKLSPPPQRESLHTELT